MSDERGSWPEPQQGADRNSGGADLSSQPEPDQSSSKSDFATGGELNTAGVPAWTTTLTLGSFSFRHSGSCRKSRRWKQSRRRRQSWSDSSTYSRFLVSSFKNWRMTAGRCRAGPRGCLWGIKVVFPPRNSKSAEGNRTKLYHILTVRAVSKLGLSIQCKGMAPG